MYKIHLSYNIFSFKRILKTCQGISTITNAKAHTGNVCFRRYYCPEHGQVNTGVLLNSVPPQIISSRQFTAAVVVRTQVLVIVRRSRDNWLGLGIRLVQVTIRYQLGNRFPHNTWSTFDFSCF